MTVSSVASRSYLTDTSRHYSDRGDLVVVSELVLGRASDVGSTSYIVFGYKMKNEIPTMCSSVHTYVSTGICSMKAFDMNHRNCCMASTHVLIHI